MLRSRISTGVIISGGAALAMLVAGCNAGSNTASPDVPTINGSATQTTPQPTTNTPPPTTSAANPPTATGGNAQPQPSNSNECKVADLNITLGGGDSAAGTTYRALVFTNKGGRTCTIQGFAGVSYVTGDDGHQVGPAAFRTGSKGAVITLKPGESANAAVGFVQVRNYDPNVCKPTETRGLRVYPPHDYDSAFVANPGLGCAGTPPGNQLTVATVQPGTGPAA